MSPFRWAAPLRPSPTPKGNTRNACSRPRPCDRLWDKEAHNSYFCKMLTRFMAHIDQHLSFLSGKRLLLACSGGVDSVVLAHLAQAAGLDIDLAHCNFGLRGVESEGDEAFVRQLAQTMGVGIMVRTFDTENHALTHRGSIQMAARELRYQWFDALMDEKG